MNPNFPPSLISRISGLSKSSSFVVAGLLSTLGIASAAPFTPGNLAILQAEASASNTTASIIELNPSSSGQTPSNTIAVDGTGASALRFSGSATSTCYLSNTNDGTLLSFNGVNNTNTSSNVNTLNPRAVGTLSAAGNFTLQTTYTGASSNQTRSSTSLDNSTWFIADQNGLYTNGTSAASPSANLRSIKPFGGVVYALQALSTAGFIAVNTVSAASGGTITGLPGLTNISDAQDFHLISSGVNGSTYDVLYILRATTNTAGTVNKYSLVSGTWVANGTYTTAFGGFGLASKPDAGGASLFVSSGLGAATANNVIKLTDAAGYNSAISITTGNNVTLYTAPTGKIVKGVAFAPVAPVVNQPDLTISATAPATGTTGVNFAYTVTVSNAGSADATGVAADFTLPAGLTFVSASGTGGFTGVNNSGTVQFTGGSINASATATLTVNVFTGTAATYTAAIGAAVVDPANTIAESNETNNSSALAASTVVSAPAPTGTVSIAAASIIEGNSGTSILSMPVTRTNTATDFTVNYAVTGGTATSGTDYAAVTPGTLTFTAGGPATQTIDITVNGDTTIEVNETVIVTLSGIANTTGITTLGTAAANGTITNDDAVPSSFPASGALTSAVKGSIGLAGAEIPAFDPLSKRAFTSSNVGVQVVNLTNPASPVFLENIAPASLGVSGLTSNDVSSIAVRKGSGANPSVLAAAIISSPKSNPGYVIFLNAATGALLGSTQVGANPDHIAFTPDGTKLLVANEGELVGVVPNVSLDTTVGSVSIIDISGGFTTPPVTTADFTAYDSPASIAALKSAGVRIFQGGIPSTDFEPEYFGISADGTKAMVTLQEANAVATLDIATATFTSVVPLGKKDFSTGRHDFSDRDGAGATNLVNPTTGSPVFGLYTPDAIASYQVAGQTYYITANEGDDRNDFLNPAETTTVANAGYVLDPTVFPNAAALKNNASLGRLTVCNAPGLRGDTDGDGDIDEILSYGGRSFSILDAAGNRVFDSGDMIENIVASQFPANFDDGRSDNKGPEPEGVTIATIGARSYAFVGLERSHMVLAFDVTNPAAVSFVSGFVRPGDLNPEGLVVVAAADSPNGKPLLLVASEVSNTLTVFEITQTVDYTLQVLHYYGESGLLGIQTAPIMGALIDKFDDLYPNTVVLAEGDSFIPGPWLIAGADPSLSAVGGIGSTALGRPDFAIMNAFGTTASAIGNHEFDLGSPVFQAALVGSGAWPGAQFPLITANLDFTADSSLKPRADVTIGGSGGAIAGLEVTAIKAKIAPYAIKTLNGQKIGIVGATTYDLLTKSSPNGTVPKTSGAVTEEQKTAEVAAYIQGAVSALQALNVNKIVMVDQLDTLARDKVLAPQVSGIDIIVAGGGHERMGDANDTAVGFNGHDANFGPDAYPILTAGLDGKPVLIVTTDTEYTYLGRLVVNFDADGVLITQNLDSVINGAYASTEATLQAAYGTANSAATIIAGSTIGTQVKAITDALNAIVIAKDSSVFGYTNVYLEGDRVFGRTQEVNQGNITADANAWKARSALGLTAGDAVFSLKNGGGIRASLGSVLGDGTKVAPLANPITGKPAKGISQLDIENSLRFDNKLMAFDTTPTGLKNILEYAAGLSSGPTVQNGGYPQVGNVRFSYNSALSAGSRVRSVALVNDAGEIVAEIVENGAVLPTAPSIIKCVALSFTANGGDGYPIKYLNPPTNTIVNNETSNFRLMLTNGGLSAAVTRSLDFTATTTITGLGLTVADILGEQKAFSDFLADRHPSLATAYNVADTPVALDTRIQQLAFRSDSVLSGPATFAAWLASNGYSSTGIDTDTDGDGLNDSVEYFFNLNPNDGADFANLPQLFPNGGAQELDFTFNNTANLTGKFEVSGDLTNWETGLPGVDYTVASSVVTGDETAVTYALPGTGPSAPGVSPTYLVPNTSDPVGASLGGVRVVNEGLVGVGRISGEDLDSFGETQGAASGLFVTDWAWNGSQFSGKFQVLPDRGYNTGTLFSNYAARLHRVDFTFSPHYGNGPVAQGQIVPTYVNSTKFTYQDGATTKFTTGLNPGTATGTLFGQTVGVVTAANGPGGAQESLLAFDAEAVHLFPDGSGYVSDEYGCYIARFNPAKQITGVTQLPEAARPRKGAGNPLVFDALAAPTFGRRNNQGLEGLSVTPDGTRLLALMQSALVQDTNGTQQQTRVNARLFVYDIVGGNRETPVLVGEYVVKLPLIDLDPNTAPSALDGTAAQSEIVAIGNTSFLMLPRDGNGLGKGTTVPITFKSVQLVDFASATNILGLYDGMGGQISPAGVLRPSINAAATAEIVNLIDPADLAKFGLNVNTASPNSNTLNEKIEGMALVPDLSTPQQNDFFLFVASDNDFESANVRMLNAAGTVANVGDGRLNAGITNDALFYAWRLTIDGNGKRFFRIGVSGN